MSGYAPLPVPPRFWARVERGAASDCWPWKAATASGYGRISVNGHAESAHRVSWSLANNRPVPSGLCVCHSCDNRLCVNPGHLWLGSCRDNLTDMTAKRRHARHGQTHCKFGHEFNPENTRMAHGQRYCRECEKVRSRAKRLRARARSAA